MSDIGLIAISDWDNPIANTVLTFLGSGLHESPFLRVLFLLQGKMQAIHCIRNTLKIEGTVHYSNKDMAWKAVGVLFYYNTMPHNPCRVWGMSLATTDQRRAALEGFLFISMTLCHGNKEILVAGIHILKGTYEWDQGDDILANVTAAHGQPKAKIRIIDSFARSRLLCQLLVNFLFRDVDKLDSAGKVSQTSWLYQISSGCWWVNAVLIAWYVILMEPQKVYTKQATFTPALTRGFRWPKYSCIIKGTVDISLKSADLKKKKK